MSVKRYEWMACDEHACHCDVVESAEGDMVDYEDYAALEARCAALAAELSAVEAIHNEAVFITDDRYEQCPPEVQKMIRSLAVLQIPAYQSFLAEVRAQGVEMFAAHKRERQQALRSRSMRMSEEAAGMAADAENFADELRKGVQ
ncbi:hypothetical protein [Enterobacter hormaechei]|uniref:hypothetical protein n=1 Tax=Enterobacter hormaechei TaxID=158836 RepID=UPI002016D3B8|nr:hypothetical protein [Enterobacter hormaechei]